MIQGIRLGNVMVDRGDENALCDFYSKLLGWEKCVLYEQPAVRSDEGVIFLFASVEAYTAPVWPERENKQQKQMHFDFQVPNLTAAVREAQALGAVKAEYQFGGDEYISMLDPAGHPFCLCALHS